jgi:integrase
MEAKSNVLSPSTMKGYTAISRNYPEWFADMNIYDVTQLDLQRVVNEYASDHSPKTVRNFHALMVASINMYRPNIVFKTTLPQKESKEVVVPKQNDVIRLLDAMREHDFYPCMILGCLGLRRSEILALEPSDFGSETVSITKAKVTNAKSEYVIKKPKTTASARTIFVPSEVVNIIKKRGYVYKGYPNTLIEVMHRYQDKIDMPRCRFHDLRHFYVSYAHSVGMSEADIIASVGHSTSEITKRVYRHAMNSESEQERIAKSMFNI